LYAEPGAYVLAGSSPWSLRTFWPDALDEADAGRIEIAAGTSTQLEWPLIRKATLRGRVLAEDGSMDPSAPQATVRWFAGGTSSSERPDSGGRFAMHGLRPGTYTLRVDPGPDSDYSPTWFGDTTMESEARTIELSAGDWIDGIEIRQRRR
jgi:hypothetical protein